MTFIKVLIVAYQVFGLRKDKQNKIKFLNGNVIVVDMSIIAIDTLVLKCINNVI